MTTLLTQISWSNHLAIMSQSKTQEERLLPEPIKGLKENPFLDSYVIEFLDLPKNFKEADLRKGLIQNMKDFILEVGKDFYIYS